MHTLECSQTTEGDQSVCVCVCMSVPVWVCGCLWGGRGGNMPFSIRSESEKDIIIADPAVLGQMFHLQDSKLERPPHL